jgi:hypothetical protein
MTLVIADASHEAAKYAVTHWHYSRTLPAGKLVKFGVWEDKKFIGVVLYARGASPHLGTAIGADQTEFCELVRVALTSHKAPVSQIVAESLKKLKVLNPGLRVVFSFADPKEGHKGGIYQAGNWIYTGISNPVTEYFIDGRWRHVRGVYHYPERKTAPVRTAPGKYRYIYPLDKATRRKVEKLRLPYPSAVEGSEASRNTSGIEGQVQSLPTALSEQ